MTRRIVVCVIVIKSYLIKTVDWTEAVLHRFPAMRGQHNDLLGASPGRRSKDGFFLA